MEKRLELYGWLLFLVGIAIWMTQAVLAGDILGMLGGVAWSVGCFLFILAYVLRKND